MPTKRRNCSAPKRFFTPLTVPNGNRNIVRVESGKRFLEKSFIRFTRVNIDQKPFCVKKIKIVIALAKVLVFSVERTNGT